MSYVIWEGSPVTMTKGTISMWFRVPQEMAEKVPSNETELGWYYDVLPDVIPLVAFSSQQDGPYQDFDQPVINTFYHNFAPPSDPPDYRPVPYYGLIAVQRPAKMSPSYIGVLFKGGEAILVAHLQTSDMGQGENTLADVTAAEGEVDEEGRLFGPTSLTFANSSSLDQKREFFPPAVGWITATKRKVAFDKWHHVLLSWELGEGNSAHGRVDDDDAPLKEFVDSHSLLYCSLDDQNLVANDLPCQYWFDDMDDNAIFCDGVFGLAGNPYGTNPDDDPLLPPYSGLPTYSVSFENGIQMDTVAVPSHPRYERTQFHGSDVPVTPILQIEVAELQIFGDLLLDTSEVDKRRAFIDYERNAEGNIVQDHEGNNLMKPVDPKRTEELLGRRPHVLLHRVSNWKKGKNTGSLGRDSEGNEILTGQFTPSGTISRYKPDPSLGVPAA